MKKVWFITGSSRGLGYSLTEAVLRKGDYVAATARNPEQLKDLQKKISGPDVDIKTGCYEQGADQAGCRRHH